VAGGWRIKVTTGQLPIREVRIADARWTGDRTLVVGDVLDLSSVGGK
jgi:hypothetical protein